MAHIWVGIVTILIGALFCFRGNVALRAVMAIWGAFAVLVALLFGVLAYAFYALAVVITMGSIGLGLGTLLATVLGVENDVAVAVISLLGAAALAILAITTNLPYLLLVIISAIGGAGAMVAGLLLALEIVGIGVDEATVQQTLGEQWWWTLVHLALAAAGVAVQLRSSARKDLQREWRSAQARRA